MSYHFEWIEHEGGYESRIGPLLVRYGPPPHRSDTPAWWRVDLRTGKEHIAGGSSPSVEFARVEAENCAKAYLEKR